ncbi:acetyl-CoA synthetase-like protein [Cubamyces lactineus]|nr:acetyl-CoA synthetase-like protein [Cubamyces lactineus]
MDTTESRRPTPQGVNHPTFKAAPFEHGLSIARLYQYHAQHSPSHPVFTYADPTTGEVHDITYASMWKSISAVSDIVLERYTSSACKLQGDDARPIIGIMALSGGCATSFAQEPTLNSFLCRSDALSYIHLEVAIMALGYIAFPLSPRNSAVVTAHLLEKMAVCQLYVSVDDGMQKLARAAAEILAEKGLKVDIVSMITPEDMSKPANGTGEAAMKDIGDSDVSAVLHSSGTTAFPKPIPITRRGLVNLANIPCFGEVDLAGKRIAGHTNPMFHAMGLATLILTSGAAFALYPPTLSPTVPTPANFLDAWTACKCNIVFCVPVFIEAWARDPANLPTLKALDCIIFSGASVNKAIGDMLATAGVTLHPFWGRQVSVFQNSCTEVGPATMFIPRDAPPVDEWEYFKFSHHITFYLAPEERLPGIFEPIMLPTKSCFPHVTNSELNGTPVFAVGDLLERHPTDPGRWKVFGRKDDQIMLSTAENVNPVPIEGMIAQDPHVASAIMFGRHRIQTGVLVEPAPSATIAPGDAQKMKEFKDSIWPTIEKANARAPAYAHIKREMIIVASPDKPLVYTPKGTPRRATCLALYADEIERLYAKREETDVHPEQREFFDRM